jgi:mannosyltransferase
MGVVDSSPGVAGRDQAVAWARRPQWVDPGIVGVSTFAVFLFGVSRPAWSGDEAATVVILRRTGAQFWAAVRHDPAIGPYYVLMKPLSMLSMSPLALRLPSALAMAGAAVVLFVLVRRAAGVPLATGSCIALALMPAVSRYGQDARPYALAVLGVTTAVWCWWRFVDGAGRRWGVGLGVALVLTGLMHAYGLLICAPLLLLAVLRPGGIQGRAFVGTLVVVLVASIALAPFLLVLANSGVGQPDPPQVNARNVAEVWARLPVGVLQPPLAVIAAALVLGLGLVGVWLVGARRCPSVPGFELLPIAWLLLPPGLMAGIQWLSGQPGLVTRYWVICLPALAIGVSATLMCPRRGWWLPILGFSLIALLAAPTHAAIRSPDGHVGLRWVRLAEVLEDPRFEDVPLLIQGFSQRGLSANAPELSGARTPLNGDPGPGGRISPVPYKPGTEQFEALLDSNEAVLIYQQRRDGGSAVPDPEEFTQTEEVRATFSEPVVLCEWFGDALGVFAKPGTITDSADAAAAAAALEGVDADRIDCVAGV